MADFNRFCTRCTTGYSSRNGGPCPKCGHPGFSRDPVEQRSSSTPPRQETAGESPSTSVRQTVSVAPVPAGVQEPPVQAASSSFQRGVSTQKSVDGQLTELIAGQNRTTHAIRALVRFLFIQLAALTLGALIRSFALSAVDSHACTQYGKSCEPNGFLVLLYYAVWLAGVIVASRIGWRELEASNIPGENSGGAYRY